MSSSIEKEMLQAENKVESMELLSSVEDLDGGVTVEMKEPMDPKLFASMLGLSLSYWIHQTKRGVWNKLPETSDTLPANASHSVGIGGFVRNDDEELLVVQDRNGGFKGSGTVDETVDEYMEVDRTVIFSKSLAKTDIKERLAVPTRALNHINMPKGDNYVYTKDSDGKKWKFRCYTRPTGHPKPAFTAGWRKFVKAKGLKIGDEVTLSKLEDEDAAGGEPQYIIHATRATTLWGKKIVVNLPYP